MKAAGINIAALSALLVCIGCVGPNLSAVEWIQRGSEFEKEGRYAAAAKAYTKALNKDPGDANVYMYRGLVYTMLGKWERGIADLTTALKIKPDSALFYTIRGIMRFDHGDFEKAVEDAEQATRLDPESYKTFRRDMETEIRKLKHKK